MEFSVINCHIMLILILLDIWYKTKTVLVVWLYDWYRQLYKMSLKLSHVLNDSKIERKLQSSDTEHGKYDSNSDCEVLIDNEKLSTYLDSKSDEEIINDETVTKFLGNTSWTLYEA